MKKITFFIIDLLKSATVYFTIFPFTLAYCQDAVSDYPNFANWTVERLTGGTMVCTDYSATLDENWNTFDPAIWNKYIGDDPYAGRFHGSAGVIFTDDNVRVENGNLILSVKNHSPEPYKLEHLIDDPNNPGNLISVPIKNGWLGNAAPYIKRSMTGGVAHTTNDYQFGLGKYEIRCKMPTNDNLIAAFWMWHHDEVDVMDVGLKSGFLQNAFHNGLKSTVSGAPCCSFAVGCDYCETNSIDCPDSSFPCGENHYNGSIMADDWHTIKFEWTPFRMTFWVDDVKTGDFYKYYYFDKKPVKVECGDKIPEGLVKVNPAFLDHVGRGFRPMVWFTGITVNPECGFDYENNCTFKPVVEPAEFLVDYIKVHERIFEKVNLIPRCYELCTDPKSNICMDLESECYNWQYKTKDGNPWPFGYGNGINAPVVNSWSIATGNGTFLDCNLTQCPPPMNTDLGDPEVCFSYDGPPCWFNPSASCSDQIVISANVTMHDGKVITLSETLLPPSPKITEYVLDGQPGFCIDGDNYCEPFTFNYEGITHQINPGEIKCFASGNICKNAQITYQNCGQTSSSIVTVGEPDITTLIPTFLNGSPVQDVNNINSSVIGFYYPVLTGFHLIDVSIVGSSSPYTTAYFLDDHGIIIEDIDRWVKVRVTFSVGVCEFTHEFRFRNIGGMYKIQPNPTNGNFAIVIDTEVYSEQIDNEEFIEISARPERALLYSPSNTLMIESQIVPGTNIKPIAIPSASPLGVYKLLVYDSNLAAPVIFNIQKQ